MRGTLRRAWALSWLEIRYFLGRPAFWIWLAVTTILPITVATSGSTPFLKAGDSAAGGVRPWITSEIPVASILTISSVLFSTFFASILAGLSPIRDDEARVGEILDATPLTMGEYVWGKFSGILLTCLLSQLLQIVVMVGLYHLLPNPAAHEWRGPFGAWNYLHPLIVFVLPNLLLLTGISYSVGAATRQPILIFVLPFGILTSFFLLIGIASDSTTGLAHTLLPLLEPSGLRWLHDVYLESDRGVAFYNHARIALPPVFAISRVLECGLGLAAVLAAQVARTRRSRNPLPYRGPRNATPVVAMPGYFPVRPAAAAATAPLAALQMRARRPPIFSSALAVARNELRELSRQPGLYLFVPMIVFFCSLNMDKDTGMFSTQRIATSGYLAASQMPIVAVFVALLLLAYTVETMERDRACRLAALEYALPVRTTSLLLGKLLALCVVALVPLVILMWVLQITIVAQGIGGAASPGPFLILWGGLLFPAFVLWILLLMAFYSLLGQNRYLTYSLGGFILLLLTAATDKMDWVTNLFLIDSLHWSDLAPLEMDRSAIVLSRALVLASALFWGALALYSFRRREADSSGLLGRMRLGVQLRSLLPLLPFFALPLGLGIWLYVDIQQGQAGEARQEKAKDYWRRNLATWKDTSLPGIADADVTLDLHPERRSFTAHGTLTLVNFHKEPLLRIPVTPDPGWQDIHWTQDDRPVTPEDRAGLCVFTPFEGGLAPGKTLKLGFSYTAPNPGPTENGLSTAGDASWEFVLPSAVVLNSFSHSFLPQIGYDEGMGVDEDNRYDAADEAVENFHRGDRLPLFGSATPFALRLAVTAPVGFTLNGVGDPVSETTQGNRHTIVWQSPLRAGAPVRQFNLVGGRNLAVYRGKNGTAVYYLPAHHYNVAEMSQALDAARKWYGQWFAPYPWKALKLTEFPDMAGYAQSFPTNISFGEGMGFLTRSDTDSGEDTTDAFAVTAHEAAHQWWGNLVVPGKGAGSNVLSEGLAHFSATLLIEHEKGLYARRHFLRTIEREYITTRSVDSELPLASMTGDKKGDAAVTYDRGGWVFTMLSERVMGRDRMLRGLQAYVAKYRASTTHPTIADFLATMRPFAPDAKEFDAFAAQWFYAVTLPEFRITEAKCSQPAATKASPHPRWVTDFRLANVGTGRETVPVLLKDASGTQMRAVYIVLDGGATPVHLTQRTDFKPDRIVIDPDVTILQNNRGSAAASL